MIPSRSTSLLRKVMVTSRRFCTQGITRPSSYVSDTRVIQRSDIMPMAEYVEKRDMFRKFRIEERRKRRVEVGPFASFGFENYDSIWMQLHEMLYIEQFGKEGEGYEEQIVDETEAYATMIPRGDNLVATLMFGIDSKAARDRQLAVLGGLEGAFCLCFDGERVTGVPVEGDEVERAVPGGKTSAVHFLNFQLTPAQREKFLSKKHAVSIESKFEAYQHAATLGRPVVDSLCEDLV